MRSPTPNYHPMTTVFTALLSAVIGGVITWLFLQARQAGQSERLRSREEENNRLNSEVTSLRAEGARLLALTTQLQTVLDAERDAHVRTTNEFKAISADVLKASNASFLELATARFSQLQQASAGDLEKRQQAIDALLKPIRESLDKVGTSVTEIDKARAQAYGQLSEQLKTLGVAQAQLQSVTGNLSTALSATKTSGTWGEIQLRRVVELAGMTSYCDFDEQSTQGGGLQDRPDLVVRLPAGQLIVVDAKAPNAAYREAANAADEPTRVAKLAEHALKVRNHIDALGGKDYWAQFQPSPEFVVLFLPGDQFLAGALQADPSLLDRAIAKKVLLATPATLIALLKAAAYGWRQEDVSRNAQVIADLGRALYDRIAGFAENRDKVGRGLETANKAYNSAVGTFEQTVLPGARKFSELGAKGVKELTEPAPAETQPRDILKRS